ncbi:DUF1963 domain-containing protein [Spirochaeta cellobiosiphila]|uniref:DUF1963 domain-containing protein n=1 Tax=Spirochaeta cellobiosiphila TaxID=504483 RepID=UPI000412E062|nr:DUF1963 domain-containing protein [Spirochaeta cellobiosiphila]
MEKDFSIIKFEPTGKEYLLPDSNYSKKHLEFCEKYSIKKTLEEIEAEYRNKYDDYREIDIPIGASRIGGPIVDLPNNIEYPENHFFMAQLNLSEFSQHDSLGLLPKEGFLYFFMEKGYGDEGKVFYSSCSKKELQRIKYEHNDWYYSGQLIGNIRNDRETFDDRFIVNDGIKEWDYFARDDVSKIYGIYTNCQASEEEIRYYTNNEEILLLHIGSNFLGEGVHCVFIDKTDLKNKDFSDCRFDYNQS